MRLALLILFVLAAAGCKKPTPEECEQMCWKFNELAFWEAFDKETADLSAPEKEKARAERQEIWNEIRDRAFDRGLENCVTNCRDQGKKSQVGCMERAKTAAAARACFED